MTQPENQIRRGRWKLVGVHEVEGYEGRVRAANLEWDPDAVSLSDDLAQEMMKDPMLIELVRRQRPDLFTR
jgi:hypothetical protein